MHRRIEPKRQVDGVAILHDEHLARAPRGRSANRDAAMMRVRIVVDDDHARHARQCLVDVARLPLLEHVRGQVRAGRREAIESLGDELRRVHGRLGRLLGASLGAAAGRRPIGRIGKRRSLLEHVLRRRHGSRHRSRRRGLLRHGGRLLLGRRRLLLNDLDFRQLPISRLRGILCHRRRAQSREPHGKNGISFCKFAHPLPPLRIITQGNTRQIISVRFATFRSKSAMSEREGRDNGHKFPIQHGKDETTSGVALPHHNIRVHTEASFRARALGSCSQKRVRAISPKRRAQRKKSRNSIM